MIKIRQSTFETNSSSTHAFCLCLKSDYNSWVAGKMLFDKNKRSGKYLVTIDEASEYCREHFRSYIKRVKVDEEISYLYNYDFYTFHDYSRIQDEEATEEDFAELRTPNGDDVVAFWYYGYDG